MHVMVVSVDEEMRKMFWTCGKEESIDLEHGGPLLEVANRESVTLGGGEMKSIVQQSK